LKKGSDILSFQPHKCYNTKIPYGYS